MTTIIGDEDGLMDIVDKNLAPLPLSNLSLGINTSAVYIKGNVTKKWPLQRTKTGSQQRFQISDDTLANVIVTLNGKQAEDCQALKEEDSLVISNFDVKEILAENDEEAYNIVVDRENSHCRIWAASKQGEPTVHTGSSQRQYTYSPLTDLKSGTIVNVYGIVKFFKDPGKTRGTDHSMMFSITDPTLDSDQKLKCMIFARDKDTMPKIKAVGDIIRIHRLKITTFKNELQGQAAPGFACLVFDREPGNFVPRTNNKTYTLLPNDLEIVGNLRVHGQNYQFSQDEGLDDRRGRIISSLSDVTIGAYFNLTCQVIATCVIKEDVGMILKVWDGTKLNHPVYEEDTDTAELRDRLVLDDSLVRKARGCMVDVFVFDNHYQMANTIKPGDFVYMQNLHAAHHKFSPDEADITPTIEFCLHQGTWYGRKIERLDPDSDSVRKLQLLLQEAADESRSDETSGEPSIFLNSREEPRPTSEENMDTSTLESDRCMANTATVLVDHYRQKRSMLRDVIAHAAPHKFRIKAQILRFTPNTENLQDFLQLYCVECNFLSPVPDLEKNQRAEHNITDTLEWYASALPVQVKHGINLFSCPTCMDKRNDNPDDINSKPVILRYIYMMKFVIRDETGQIDVRLWKDEARKFFNDLPVVKLLKERERYPGIRNQLLAACPSSAGERPWIEACIMKYTTHSGVTYQIFDTQLALP